MAIRIPTPQEVLAVRPNVDHLLDPIIMQLMQPWDPSKGPTVGRNIDIPPMSAPERGEIIRLLREAGWEAEEHHDQRGGSWLHVKPASLETWPATET